MDKLFKSVGIKPDVLEPLLAMFFHATYVLCTLGQLGARCFFDACYGSCSWLQLCRVCHDTICLALQQSDGDDHVQQACAVHCFQCTFRHLH